MNDYNFTQNEKRLLIEFESAKKNNNKKEVEMLRDHVFDIRRRAKRKPRTPGGKFD